MPNASKNTAVSVENAKSKKARLKRKTPSLESCVRTDLLELCPKPGKAAALDKLVDYYQQACLDALIKGGACLDDASYSPRRERGVGSAPLLLAIIGANHSCVGSLARAGADLSVHDEHGRGPARLCAAYQVAESLAILIKAGVELELGDEHAAHAANHGKGEIYRMIKAERERRETEISAAAGALPFPCRPVPSSGCRLWRNLELGAFLKSDIAA